MSIVDLCAQCLQTPSPHQRTLSKVHAGDFCWPTSGCGRRSSCTARPASSIHPPCWLHPVRSDRRGRPQPRPGPPIPRGGLSPRLLEELLYVDRDLLDGWDKMASIHLTTDWPYFAGTGPDAHAARQPSNPAMEIAPTLLQEIGERGPVLQRRRPYSHHPWSWDSEPA